MGFLVSSPDPAPKRREKGLGTSVRILGCAPSATFNRIMRLQRGAGRPAQRRHPAYHARTGDSPTTLSVRVAMAFSCVVCGADLPTAVKRRVLHPPNEANADVHEFFVSVVAPEYSFASDTVRYACRYTCFATLQKAVKHHVALQDVGET